MPAFSKCATADEIEDWEDLPEVMFNIKYTKLAKVKDLADHADYFKMIKVIKSEADYNKFHPAFEKSARRWGILSLDTEQLFSVAKGDQNLPQSLVLIVAATPDGRIIVLDLRHLSNVPLAQRTREDVRDSIPPAFRKLLVAPRVLKTGSGIRDDVGITNPKLGVLVAPIKDTQSHFQEHRHVTLPEMAHKPAKSGLELLVMGLGGPQFKPGYPKMRSLYEWRDPLTPEQLDYIRLDALGPALYLVRATARLAGQLSPRPRTWMDAIVRLWYPRCPVLLSTISVEHDITADNYTNVILDRIADRFPIDADYSVRGSVGLLRPAGYDDDEDDDDRADDFDVAHHEAFEHDELGAFARKVASAKRNVSNVGLVPEPLTTEPDPDVTVDRKPGREEESMDEKLSRLTMSKFQCTKKLRLAYRHKFALPQHCHFCGDIRHQRYRGKSRVTRCPVEIRLKEEGIVRFCTYPLCGDPESHVIAACHVLHARCGTCANRGHRGEHCDTHSQDDLRDFFQMYAGLGRYTRKRAVLVEWSYYPVLFEDYHDLTKTTVSKFPYTADELDNMAHETATDLVVAFNARVRARLGVQGTAPKGLIFTAPYVSALPTLKL